MLARLPLLAALLLAASATAAPDTTAEPDVYAVVFYADWCGSCQVLEPTLRPIMQSMADDKAVRFVTFDMTDAETVAATAEAAASLGLDAVYDDHAGKTGFVLLVDAGSGDVLGRIESRDDADAIRSALRDAVERAS